MNLLLLRSCWWIRWMLLWQGKHNKWEIILKFSSREENDKTFQNSNYSIITYVVTPFTTRCLDLLWFLHPKQILFLFTICFEIMFSLFWNVFSLIDPKQHKRETANDKKDFWPKTVFILQIKLEVPWKIFVTYFFY